jgi:PTH1 family peptidyl-tRNA hydrolase
MRDNTLFCLVGLGNPGIKYQNTRHNAGFLVIDHLVTELGGVFRSGFDSKIFKFRMDREQILAVKPQTFMNCSGRAVLQVVEYYQISLDRLLIIYDDLDLPLGLTRLRLSGSAGGHRGLNSVLETLKTQEIPRLRLGIGRPTAGGQIPIVDYVLTPFEPEERKIFNHGIKRAAEAALSFVINGPQTTMDRFNTKTGPGTL